MMRVSYDAKMPVRSMGYFPGTYTFVAPNGTEFSLVEVDTRSPRVEWVVFTWTPDMDRTTDHAVGVPHECLEDAMVAIMEEDK